eukprot:c12530_g1_i2.p1 GENE.c12530_g1_i2~~c12530_g1_i2.p1  ORF type:complete len:476 (+),score=62.36 c12530_g1_i2:346-1773(+)
MFPLANMIFLFCKIVLKFVLFQGINRQEFSEEEDKTLMELVQIHGSCWSIIARHFDNRPHSALKNRYFLLVRHDKAPKPSSWRFQFQPLSSDRDHHRYPPSFAQNNRHLHRDSESSSIRMHACRSPSPAIHQTHLDHDGADSNHQETNHHFHVTSPDVNSAFKFDVVTSNKPAYGDLCHSAPQAEFIFRQLHDVLGSHKCGEQSLVCDPEGHNDHAEHHLSFTSLNVASTCTTTSPGRSCDEFAEKSRTGSVNSEPSAYFNFSPLSPSQPPSVSVKFTGNHAACASAQLKIDPRQRQSVLKSIMMNIHVRASTTSAVVVENGNHDHNIGSDIDEHEDASNNGSSLEQQQPTMMPTTLARASCNLKQQECESLQHNYSKPCCIGDAMSLSHLLNDSPCHDSCAEQSLHSGTIGFIAASTRQAQSLQHRDYQQQNIQNVGSQQRKCKSNKIQSKHLAIPVLHLLNPDSDNDTDNSAS